MSTVTQRELERPAPHPAPDHPVLESGDRLTRVELHRRYSARPDLQAERGPAQSVSNATLG